MRELEVKPWLEVLGGHSLRDAVTDSWRVEQEDHAIEYHDRSRA